MNFYEKNKVAESYVSQVRDYLIYAHHMGEIQAEEVIREADLMNCIQGCPHIAMHYPANITARKLADKYTFSSKQILAEKNASHTATI